MIPNQSIHNCHQVQIIPYTRFSSFQNPFLLRTWTSPQIWRRKIRSPRRNCSCRRLVVLAKYHDVTAIRHGLHYNYIHYRHSMFIPPSSLRNIRLLPIVSKPIPRQVISINLNPTRNIYKLRTLTTTTQFKMPQPLTAEEVNSKTDPSTAKQWDDTTPKSEQIEDFYKTVDGLKIGLLTTIRDGIGPVSRSMAVAKVFSIPISAPHLNPSLYSTPENLR